MPKKNLPTPEATVTQLCKEYPTLFGRSKIKALDHLFITNGSGYEWIDGAIQYSRHEQEAEPSPSWEVVLKGGLESLRGKDPTDWNSRHSCMLEAATSPIHFSQLSLDIGSPLAQVPKNVTDDWLKAVVLTLGYVLHYRSTPRSLYFDPEEPYTNAVSEVNEHDPIDNKANALILLCQYENQFGKRPVWKKALAQLETIAPYYKGAKFWEIPARREQRLLELSIKCASDEAPFNQGEDPFSKLSLKEYLDYLEVDSTGFEKNLTLLVELCHHKIDKRLQKLVHKHKDNKRLAAVKQAIGKGTKKGNTLIIKLTPEVQAIHNIQRLF